MGTIAEHEVTNIATLIERVESIYPLFDRTRIWYRGLPSTGMKLVPSVHRQFDPDDEHDMVVDFVHAAPMRYAKCPERHDFSSWLCLMRHFGLPTRLLDWTSSLLTAVFFALDDDQSTEPAVVWSLIPALLNKSSKHDAATAFLLHGPEAMALVRAPFITSSEPDISTLAVMAEDVDLRMAVQQGAFTIHGDATPLEERVGAEKYLNRFIIPAASKERLRREVRALGIRRSMLFPDLSNLAIEIKDQYLFRQRLYAAQRASAEKG